MRPPQSRLLPKSCRSIGPHRPKPRPRTGVDLLTRPKPARLCLWSLKGRRIGHHGLAPFSAIFRLERVGRVELELTDSRRWLKVKAELCHGSPH
jgi:hypothetical protein